MDNSERTPNPHLRSLTALTGANTLTIRVGASYHQPNKPLKFHAAPAFTVWPSSSLSLLLSAASPPMHPTA